MNAAAIRVAGFGRSDCQTLNSIGFLRDDRRRRGCLHALADFWPVAAVSDSGNGSGKYRHDIQRRTMCADTNFVYSADYAVIQSCIQP